MKPVTATAACPRMPATGSGCRFEWNFTLSHSPPMAASRNTASAALALPGIDVVTPK